MALQTTLKTGEAEDLVFDVYVRDHRKLPPAGGLPSGTQAWFTVENARGELVFSVSMGQGISVVDPVKAIVRVAVPRDTVMNTIDLQGKEEVGGFTGELIVQTPAPSLWFSEQVRADIVFQRSINRSHAIGP